MPDALMTPVFVRSEDRRPSRSYTVGLEREARDCAWFVACGDRVINPDLTPALRRHARAWTQARSHFVIIGVDRRATGRPHKVLAPYSVLTDHLVKAERFRSRKAAETFRSRFANGCHGRFLLVVERLDDGRKGSING